MKCTQDNEVMLLVDEKGGYELKPRLPLFFNVKLFSIFFSAAIKQDRLP